MKLIPNVIAKHLPVSRKTHERELDNANKYLLDQLKQVTAANIQLERKLYNGDKA